VFLLRSMTKRFQLTATDTLAFAGAMPNPRSRLIPIE
jgi:hypothetical protein